MNQHGARITAFTRESICLRAIMPLSFLVLTCCMAQVEAGTRPQPEDAKSPLLTRTSEQPAQSPISAPQPNTLTIASNVSDPVQEGRMLLGKKSSDPGAKKSKDKGKAPAKRLDASAEEEEEEEEEDVEDEGEDAEDSSGNGAGGIGKHTIQADFDKNVTATLKEVVARGAVLSVTVSLNFQGGKDKKQSESLSTSETGKYTHVLDYESGTEYPIKKIDGFDSGRLQRDQEVKTLRATFEAPPENAKSVGITIYGIGTFDDVKLGSSGGALSGQHTGSSETEDIEEEDEEDEEDVEEEDSKGLTKKKGAKKAAKKGAKKGAK